MKNPLILLLITLSMILSLGESKQAEAGNEEIEALLKFLELFFELGSNEGFVFGAESYYDLDNSYMFGCVMEAGVTGLGMTLSTGYSEHYELGEAMYFGLGLKFSFGDLVED